MCWRQLSLATQTAAKNDKIELMLITFAHNGHDHVQEITQAANSGYATPILITVAVIIIASTILFVVKRKKKAQDI